MTEINAKDPASRDALQVRSARKRALNLMWQHLGNASVLEVEKTENPEVFRLRIASGTILVNKEFTEKHDTN